MKKTDKIQIHNDLRQGDTASPKLFTLALENVFKQLPSQKKAKHSMAYI